MKNCRVEFFHLRLHMTVAALNSIKAHINFEVGTRFDILFVLIVKKSILGNFTEGEDKQKKCVRELHGLPPKNFQSAYRLI